MKFLRNIVIAALILNSLGSTLVVPLIYLDFNLRREYIARVLCIKKEEPITVCGGKCYLTNRLKKATQHQQEEDSTVHQKFQFSFFNHLITSISLDPFSFDVLINYSFLKNLWHPASYTADIFHPPKV